LCWHTAVGGGLSTWNYFNRDDVGVYSHGVVCGIWGSDAGQDVDGLALQMADTDYRAAANLNGNYRVISWETGDNATRPIQPWTPAQCETIVRIMVDANRLDGIPLTLVPDSKPGRRGICYHRQGVDPYRVDGGELWSSSYGKDCPTDARIQQLPGLIERARAIVAGEPEDDMPLNDADKAWLRSLTGAGGGVTVVGVSQDVYNRLNTALSGLKGELDGLQRDVADIKAALSQVQPPVTSGFGDPTERDA
jgi:hypothetical protein